MSQVKIILGTHAIAELLEDDRKKVLTTLKSHNVTDIDTARGYPGSEAALGQLPELTDFTLHTKAIPASLSHSAVLEAAKESLADLGVSSFSTYFLHAPDYNTPIEETLAAVDELYESGTFKHFGLSNFMPEDVEKIHAIASSKGWVLPTVYQGNYNPVARHTEDSLFPLLRKLDISFYAYSPLAGGFFAKDPDALIKGSESGRFDPTSFGGQMYNKLYNKPSLIAGLRVWGNIAQDAGVNKTELALRWLRHHSALKGESGDGVIIGLSKPEQLEESLKMLEKGPLPEGIAERVDQVWQSIKEEAPLDNWHSFFMAPKDEKEKQSMSRGLNTHMSKSLE